MYLSCFNSQQIHLTAEMESAQEEYSNDPSSQYHRSLRDDPNIVEELLLSPTSEAESSSTVLFGW